MYVLDIDSLKVRILVFKKYFHAIISLTVLNALQTELYNAVIH